MKRKRKSKYTKEILEPFVKKAHSLREMMKLMGYSQSSGSMFTVLSKKIKEYEIDTLHFFRSNSYLRVPTKKLLIKDCTYSRTHLKKRLLEEGFLSNDCSICGLSSEWYGKHINMILDHVNGDSADNRLKNLRMVCPNCESQLETHCGRNRKKK